MFCQFIRLNSFSIFLLFAIFIFANTDPPSPLPASLFRIQFDPFRPSTEYRCGAFVEQQGPQKDPAMKMLHSIQNSFINQISNQFPHQKLLSDEALLGQPEAWKRSFLEHRDQWIQFDRWWLLLCLCLIFIPPAFVLIFLCARCCICICQRGKKKARGTESRRTDRRWDWLRRLLLNGLIGLLVLANVFCAAILLLSTQYAQHGLDELPTRLHYCANDLLVYRSETNEQIRKLLRDDFTRFNQSLQNALDGVGQIVVQRLKEDTGVDHLENAVIRASNAPKMHSQFRQIHEELGSVLDARHSLQIRLLRLRQAREGLADCERIAKSGERAAICHQARQALLPILELAIGGDEPQADWEGEEKARELSSLLPDQLPTFLSQIEQIDIERRFSAPLEGLQLLQHGIQSVVDSRRQDADERLRLLDRTLQSHYEQISSAVKSVDLRFLDEQILDPMMRQRERFRHFVQIGWLAALIISGLFAFLSLAFLLGLCFGCCGRRPSEYDEDDCCVRSTGANFFGCSIWLSLVLISVFGIISAVSMFIGANSAYLVCDPLRHPLDRPDILSLADRLVTLWGLDKPQSTSQKSFSQIFTAKRRPADLIRGCVQGKTLYSMFELDQKFTLIGEGGPMDEYEEMANSIRQSLISGRLLESAIGQSATSNSIQQNPQSASSFGGRWNEFNAEMRNSLESLGQIQMIEWEEDSVKEFCSQRIRFQLEPILAELRRLKQSAEEHEQQQTGQKGINDVPMEELDSVLRFLEDIRPETVQVRALLEQGCAHLEQLRTDVLSLNFNSTSLLADLDRIQRDFGSEHAMRQKLHSVAGEIAMELAGMVRQYGEHVNKSMNSEVSNCSSLAEIAKNTRAAICDYALDPLNSLWLALGLGLFLLIPIILLASALNPLYRRTNSYPKYIVPSSISADCPNEARFATDIYGLAPASNCYGTSATLKANNHNNSAGYQQPISNNLCTQITSPYATSNYGYQELCPPIYMGTSRR